MVNDLFERYTVIVQPTHSITSVYCEECDEWVADYETNKLVDEVEQDFYEEIVGDHEEDVFGTIVEFDENWKEF